MVTIVALMAGFAPIFHSMCIQASSTSASSHIMADGNIMGIESEADTTMVSDSTAHALAVSHDQAPVNAPGKPLGAGDPLTLVALFIVPACLLVVGFLLLFRKSTELKFSETFFTALLARPPTWRYFPNAVNPLALGISRT